MTDADRAERAVTDVVAVETLAPGMSRVITFGGAYVVDARGEGCLCPDKKHNLGPGEVCKHHIGAMLAADDTLPAPFITTDNLSERLAADGGECKDCERLPDDVPCATCYISGDKEFNDNE
jgi:hypothetical protein